MKCEIFRTLSTYIYKVSKYEQSLLLLKLYSITFKLNVA